MSQLLHLTPAAWARRPLSAALAFAALAAPAAAQVGTNVALGKPVAVLAGSATSSNPTEGYNRITDGVFGVEGAPYTVNSVYWTGTSTFLGIALGGPFTLTGFQVQADDNDNYLLEYRDGAMGTWMTAYNVPVLISPTTGIGASTRPFFTLATPIQATDLRISAVSGDNFYAVMQVEAFTAPTTTTPEPATAALLAGGLAGIGLVARRRRGA